VASPDDPAGSSRGRGGSTPRAESARTGTCEDEEATGRDGVVVQVEGDDFSIASHSAARPEAWFEEACRAVEAEAVQIVGLKEAPEKGREDSSPKVMK